MRHGVRDSTWTKIARQDALRVQHGRCLYCFDRLVVRTVTAEHRKPRSKGGTDDRSNIGASCQPCNALKGSMGEKAFQKAIKTLDGSRGTQWLIAWSRRRINLAAMRACLRIARFVGLPDDEYRR